MAYFNDEEDVEFIEKITIRVGICAMNKKVSNVSNPKVATASSMLECCLCPERLF
jgi:hypothetical protein